MNQKQIRIMFRDMASAHESLHHTTAKPHFFRGEAEEFVNGFRSKVHFPALILESPTADYSIPKASPATETFHIAFMVVGTHTRENWDDITSAIDSCESIAKDIIVRLVRHYNLHLDDSHLEPIYNTALKYAGVRVELTISTPFDTCRDNKFTISLS